MCGFVAFVGKPNNDVVFKNSLETCLSLANFRGPDFTGTYSELQSGFYFGHNRLSIRDLHSTSNQPMVSDDHRYVLVYNGELYNTIDLSLKYSVEFTGSDTKLLFNLLCKFGEIVISDLEGMFAFVFYDKLTGNFLASRDQFGIKPLFYLEHPLGLVFSSESGILAHSFNRELDPYGVFEWEVLRGPVGQNTMWSGVKSIPPGFLMNRAGCNPYFILEEQDSPFIQEEFESCLVDSVSKHMVSDTSVGYFLSGGYDSSVIGCLVGSDVDSYSIGLENNSEISYAKDTASALNQRFFGFDISFDTLQSNWKFLAKLRFEPLQVPNEGMIYELSRKMPASTKVFLSGEGADELLFGYDRIFDWCSESEFLDMNGFLDRYSYCDVYESRYSERMFDFLFELNAQKKAINFCEDFFIKFHLPTLLRRMDFASMAASKEARVPFVNVKLFSLLYRKDLTLRRSLGLSKSPLIPILKRYNLDSVINRKKIGFSAKRAFNHSAYDEYRLFRSHFGEFR